MAIWRDGAGTGRAGADPRSHAERLPLEAVAFLAEHGLTLPEIDTFVVVAGPGSFTGLRVGVAAVQGWAMALGRPVATVPTLDALFRSMPSDVEAGTVLVPCIDGLRGEVFFSAWRDGIDLTGPQVGPAAELTATVVALAPAGRVVAAGDGAMKYVDTWTVAGWEVVAPTVALADAAARIVAAGGGAMGGPHAVRLNYVRRTDAEIVRERERGGRTA